MIYSSAGFIGLVINLIINHDVLLKRSIQQDDSVTKQFRNFLLTLNAYFVADIIWGILYEHHLIELNAIDTYVYFLTMGLSILAWTIYVVAYLRADNLFHKLLGFIGWIIFLFQMIAMAINLFQPFLFFFDENGVYHALFGRYITLVLQIIMYSMTAIYALVVSCRSKNGKRVRHFAIGLSSIAMAFFVWLQSVYPLLPLYALGCLLAACVMHSFVLENEKEEYRDTLEQRLQDSILKGNYYDLLTGMPGMTYFFELAEKQRKEMIQSGGRPAFLFFDLSGMKFYNQKFGFAEGDRLLREFSELLCQFFKKDHCSRFGSDHFAVFTEENRLEETLQRIFEIWAEKGNGEQPAIRAGIYLDAGKNADISTACDRAKTARDTIRKSYFSDYCYFDETMLERAEHAQYFTSHLDRAIEEGWIEVYYQPIIRAISGRVCDEEALARWNDPKRGFLPPADFIPILEEAGILYKLDLHVLDQVIEKMHKTEEKGLHVVPQSINISRSDFDACDIVQEICDRMDRAGLPHNLLSVEITESIIGTNFDFIKEQTERFRALGFPVWMDDFGSGYSSLDVLSDMNVDLIKLDMRFMQKFDNGEKSRIILTELMKMANAIGIDTICEGVERKEQMEFLRDIGCAKLQGYYFAKPVPLSEIFDRYETGRQIGFENPMQTGYYDAVSRINLYDVSILTHDDANTFHRFFSTIPMGILELRGNKVRFSRSNQAYRDFVKRTFHVEVGNRMSPFEDLPELMNGSFIDTLKRLEKEGGRIFFDETRQDGLTIHSFIRRIATDEVTGTTALVIAVLSVMSKDSDIPLQIVETERSS